MGLGLVLWLVLGRTNKLGGELGRFKTIDIEEAPFWDLYKPSLVNKDTLKNCLLTCKLLQLQAVDSSYLTLFKEMYLTILCRNPFCKNLCKWPRPPWALSILEPVLELYFVVVLKNTSTSNNEIKGRHVFVMLLIFTTFLDHIAVLHT